MVFYGRGGCSCTNCQQAEASPDSWCGFVPGALQRAAPWREAPWAVVQLPVPCGMAVTGCCSPKPSWERCYWGKGSPSLGPALWQGFAALLAVFVPALMCAIQDGVSLSACWVFPAVRPCAGFPCWGTLAASRLLCPISHPPFPSDPSPIRAVSSQPCVKSHLSSQLLGWIGDALLALPWLPTGADAFHPVMHLPPCIPPPALWSLPGAFGEPGYATQPLLGQEFCPS